jgi:hypothetical protein
MGVISIWGGSSHANCKSVSNKKREKEWKEIGEKVEKKVMRKLKEWADFNEITSRYNPETLKDGHNTLPDGEEVFYISNPALGLWAFKDRFNY